MSGTTLRFDRSGRRLIVIEPDEIAVVDVAAARAIRLAFRGARAVAGFDDELWIATHDEHLVRVDATGALLGAPVALPSAAHGVLAPAPCGPPAAVWSAAAPVVCATAGADATAVVCVEAGDVDAVIPITGQRAVVARGSRLTLPSGLTVALAPNSQVLGGCVTADGKLLSLLVARGAERQLVVVALGLAQVTQRRAVPPRATVAIGHGVAAIQIEPRVLRVIDLTTSRELGGVSFGQDIAAFAVGSDGRSLAIQSTTGEIELHRIDPLFPRPFTSPHRAAVGAAPSRPDDRIDLASPRVLLAGCATSAPDEPAAHRDPPEPPAPTKVERLTVDAPPVPVVLDSTLPPPPPVLPDATLEITPVATPERAPDAIDSVLVHSFSAPTVHATDWLCGSGDYMEGST